MGTRDCHVVAGIIRDNQDRVLISRRRAGTHMAGAWEFPGGKLKSGEDRQAGLRRELQEELNIDIQDSTPLIQIPYQYPDRNLLLDFWCIEAFTGEPVGAEGQALKWVHQDFLHEADILVADKPAIHALLLPDYYAIARSTETEPSRFTEIIASASRPGISMVQIRLPDLDQNQAKQRMDAALQAAPGCRFIFYGDPEITIPLALASDAAGIHLPSRFLKTQFKSFPQSLMLAASCHDAEELKQAAKLGADFVVLGPVRSTGSRSDQPGLGWASFSKLVSGAMVPVYATGGLGSDDVSDAQAMGAQGVASGSAFFD